MYSLQQNNKDVGQDFKPLGTHIAIWDLIWLFKMPLPVGTDVDGDRLGDQLPFRSGSVLVPLRPKLERHGDFTESS